MPSRKKSERDDYKKLYDGFRWAVPERLNIARECCTRWADNPKTAHQIAILRENARGSMVATTYRELRDEAAILAASLKRAGVKRGDVVAILLPQRAEVAVAHMAVYALGAIAMPLSVLFGPDALLYRLQHSKARAAIVDAVGIQNLQEVRSECAELRTLIGIEIDDDASVVHWHTLLESHAGAAPLEVSDTAASDPALLIYTSGTTGNPKGALIPHAAMFGNLPGFVASQNWFPQAGDVFWSPADWAWTGGLWDALLPTLYFGSTIVAGDAKVDGRFSPEKAFELMARFNVTNTFLFPTALKAMMKAVPAPKTRFRLRLRALMSAGESVGATVYRYCEEALGVRVNEMFGQTEVNYIVGNSYRWPAKPGSMGRPYPGHYVAVIDDDGNLCPPGVTGEVAINRYWYGQAGEAQADPIFFLGYWHNDDATRDKYVGNWCCTGDLATVDEDGYLWYQGRSDDVFKSAGYRIGPAEIENCLVKHPAVANAAVIGKPDPERTNIVKAFIVLTPEYAPTDELVAELKAFVRDKLAPYEYPREIEFLDALPMTTTGKVQRRVLRERERAAMAG